MVNDGVCSFIMSRGMMMMIDPLVDQKIRKIHVHGKILYFTVQSKLKNTRIIEKMTSQKEKKEEDVIKLLLLPAPKCLGSWG